MLRRRTPVLLVAALLFLAACRGEERGDAAHTAPAGGSPAATAGKPSPTFVFGPPDDDGMEWAGCESPDGIQVEYPQDWHTNEGDLLPACSAFDPEPLDLPAAQDFAGSAVLLSVEPVDFDTAAEPEALAGDVIERSETTVDGHDAVRVETQSSGDALLPEGTRSTRWLIVLGREQTLTLVSNETEEPEVYESHREVLDRMVPRLELPPN